MDGRDIRRSEEDRMAKPLDPLPAGTLRRGMSDALDPRVAARELADSLCPAQAGFALVFCSPHYDLPALAEALAEAFGDLPVFGCTTAGEITPMGYRSGSITGVSFPRGDFSMVAERLDGLDRFEIDDGAATVRRLRERRDADPGTIHDGDSFALLLI